MLIFTALYRHANEARAMLKVVLAGVFAHASKIQQTLTAVHAGQQSSPAKVFQETVKILLERVKAIRWGQWVQVAGE